MLKDEAPAYRLNSVQLIIGDEEKVFQFVTAPPPSKSGDQLYIANSALLHFEEEKKYHKKKAANYV